MTLYRHYQKYPPVRLPRNGGMQLVTWMVLLMVFLAGFGLGLIWHSL